MLIVDANLDLSMNAIFWNRDITRPVADIRRSELGRTEKGRGANTVSLPELRKANIGLCLATVIARVKPVGQSPLDFRTQEIAWAVAQGELAYYRALCAQEQLRQLFCWRDIADHIDAWDSAAANVPPGFLFRQPHGLCKPAGGVSLRHKIGRMAGFATTAQSHASTCGCRNR
jgi:membrane dipeptidase